MPSNQKPLLPILSLVVAATLWGVAWYPLRHLEQLGMHGLWATLVIYGSAALAGGFLLPRCYREIRQEPYLFALVAVGSAWCNVAFILAVLDGNVVRVLLLFYLSPVWSTLMAWRWLKEELGVQAWTTFFIAMTGAVIMLWNPEAGAPWPSDRADWLALSSGVAFAFANVAMRKLEGYSIESKVIVNWWGGSLLALALILLLHLPPPELSLTTYSLTASLGLVVVLIMTVSVSYGVSNLPVHQSAVILLFELVIGALSSLWLTDEIIALAEWVGGALIVAAAYLTARSARGTCP